MEFKKELLNLTRKMREAERQREEALTFAESVKRDKEALEIDFLNLINLMFQNLKVELQQI